jgi:hypothetical protein
MSAFDNQTDNDPMNCLVKKELERKLKNNPNSNSLGLSFLIASIRIPLLPFCSVIPLL